MAASHLHFKTDCVLQMFHTVCSITTVCSALNSSPPVDVQRKCLCQPNSLRLLHCGEMRPHQTDAQAIPTLPHYQNECEWAQCQLVGLKSHTQWYLSTIVIQISGRDSQIDITQYHFARRGLERLSLLLFWQRGLPETPTHLTCAHPQQDSELALLININKHLEAVLR